MVVVGVGLGAFVPAWPCSWCFALCLLCLLYARSGCEDVRFWGDYMLLRDGCNIPRCYVPGKTFDKGPATILPNDDERVPYLHFDLIRVCAGPKGVVLGFIHFDEPRLGHERCCEPPTSVSPLCWPVQVAPLSLSLPFSFSFFMPGARVERRPTGQCPGRPPLYERMDGLIRLVRTSGQLLGLLLVLSTNTVGLDRRMLRALP